MTAKIDAYQTSASRPVSVASPARVAVSGDSGSKAVSAIAQTDRVQLTGDAVSLQQFEKTSAGPANDRSRIDRIRKAVNDGSYTVNAKTVAAKVVRFEWEMSKG